MSKRGAGWKNLLVNVLLVGLGLAVLVLLYAFVSRSVAPSSEPGEAPAPPPAVAEDIIQVEVRNGCGVAGLAEDMTRYLRQRGFDVVDVGNHTSFNQAETIVVDRVGNREAARRVAQALGLPEDRVKQDIRQDYFLDASVIIGLDYASLVAFEGR